MVAETKSEDFEEPCPIYSVERGSQINKSCVYLLFHSRARVLEGFNCHDRVLGAAVVSEALLRVEELSFVPTVLTEKND